MEFVEDYQELQVGQPAPDFKMEGYFEGKMRHFGLEDYKGKWVVLFFYPLDFTFVCPTELIELSKRVKEFEKVNCQVLGVSVDSVYSHEAWSTGGGKGSVGKLDYPLLSDITKETSFDYNVLHQDGMSFRGTFIIDPDGILRSYQVNDLSVGRNIDELLRLVQAFQTGELCPIGWEPGKKTLGKA
jgi:alkyl hydroperoxide reductase subunit AhpC